MILCIEVRKSSSVAEFFSVRFAHSLWSGISESKPKLSNTCLGNTEQIFIFRAIRGCLKTWRPQIRAKSYGLHKFNIVSIWNACEIHQPARYCIRFHLPSGVRRRLPGCGSLICPCRKFNHSAPNRMTIAFLLQNHIILPCFDMF